MKKFLSLMLAVMLLALPVTSLAEFNTDLLGQQKAMAFTLTFSDANIAALVEAAGEKVDEDEAAVFTMVNDLINAIGFTGYEQQASADSMQFGYSLTLSGNDAMNIQALLQKNGIYATSNLLGKDTVLVTLDQLTAALEDAKAELIAQGGTTAELDETFAPIKELLENPGEMFSAYMKTNDLDTMELTNFLAAFEKIAEKAEKADASAAPAGSDKAESAITLKLSKDDIATLLEAILNDFEATNYGAGNVKSLNQSLALSEEKMTVDDALKACTNLMKDDVIVTLYTGADGNVVSATVKAALLEEVDSKDVVDLDMVILNNKVDDQQKVTVTATATEDDEKVDVLFELNMADKDNGTFNCTVTEDDTLVKVNGTIQATADKHTTVNVKLDVTDGEDKFGMGFLVTAAETESSIDMQMKLTSLDGATTYLSILMNCALADMMPAVNTADAVQPLAMSEEEMEAWTASLETGMQMELVKIIQYLPTSVLQMMMQQQ